MTRRAGRAPRLAAVGVAALVLAGAEFEADAGTARAAVPALAPLELGTGERPPSGFRPAPFSVTAQPGREGSPAVSPSGAVLAYVSDRDGQCEIWLRFLPGSGRVGEAPVTSSLADDEQPAFSLDGRYLAYVSREQDAAGDIMVVDLLTPGVLGGPLAEAVEMRLALADLAPAAAARVRSAAGVLAGQPLQSRTRLTDERAAEERPSWSRDALWFLRRAAPGAPDAQLIRVAWPAGEERIVVEGAIEGFAVDDAGQSLALVRRQDYGPTRLWLEAIGDAQAKECIALPGVTDPAFEPGTDRLVFLAPLYDTNRDGRVGRADRRLVWSIAGGQVRSGEAVPVPLTDALADAGRPHAGPDGRVYFEETAAAGEADIRSIPLTPFLPAARGPELRSFMTELEAENPELHRLLAGQLAARGPAEERLRWGLIWALATLRTGDLAGAGAILDLIEGLEPGRPGAVLGRTLARLRWEGELALARGARPEERAERWAEWAERLDALERALPIDAAPADGEPREPQQAWARVALVRGWLQARVLDRPEEGLAAWRRVAEGAADAASAAVRGEALWLMAEEYGRIGALEGQRPALRRLVEEFADVVPDEFRFGRGTAQTFGELAAAELVRTELQVEESQLADAMRALAASDPQARAAVTHQLGLLHERRGEWEDARRVYARLQEEGAGRWRLMGRLGEARALFGQGKYRESLDLFQSVATELGARDPLYWQVRREYLTRLLEKGDGEIRGGEAELAAHTYRQLLTFDGGLWEAHRGLIRAYASMGRADAAAALYRAALAAGGPQAQLTYGVGLATTYLPFSRSTFAEAEEWLRRAVALAGDVAYPHQTLGFVYEKQGELLGWSGRLDRAADHYLFALSLLERDAPAQRRADLLLNAGNALYGLDSLGPAYRMYAERAAIPVPFDQAVAEFVFRRRYGRCCYHAGAHAEGVAQYRRALELLGEDATAAGAERASQPGLPGIDPVPAAAEIWDGIGLIQQEAERYEEAVAAFARAAALHAESGMVANQARALRNAGVNLVALGRSQQGVARDESLARARASLQQAEALGRAAGERSASRRRREALIEVGAQVGLGTDASEAVAGFDAAGERQLLWSFMGEAEELLGDARAARALWTAKLGALAEGPAAPVSQQLRRSLTANRLAVMEGRSGAQAEAWRLSQRSLADARALANAAGIEANLRNLLQLAGESRDAHWLDEAIGAGRRWMDEAGATPGWRLMADLGRAVAVRGWMAADGTGGAPADADPDVLVRARWQDAALLGARSEAARLMAAARKEAIAAGATAEELAGLTAGIAWLRAPDPESARLAAELGQLADTGGWAWLRPMLACLGAAAGGANARLAPDAWAGIEEEWQRWPVWQLGDAEAAGWVGRVTDLLLQDEGLAPERAWALIDGAEAWMRALRAGVDRLVERGGAGMGGLAAASERVAAARQRAASAMRAFLSGSEGAGASAAAKREARETLAAALAGYETIRDEWTAAHSGWAPLLRPAAADLETVRAALGAATGCVGWWELPGGARLEWLLLSDGLALERVPAGGASDSPPGSAMARAAAQAGLERLYVVPDPRSPAPLAEADALVRAWPNPLRAAALLPRSGLLPALESVRTLFRGRTARLAPAAGRGEPIVTDLLLAEPAWDDAMGRPVDRFWEWSAAGVADGPPLVRWADLPARLAEVGLLRTPGSSRQPQEAARMLDAALAMPATGIGTVQIVPPTDGTDAGAALSPLWTAAVGPALVDPAAVAEPGGYRIGLIGLTANEGELFAQARFVTAVRAGVAGTTAGQWTEALAGYEEALAIEELLGESAYRVAILTNASRAALELGAVERAHELARSAVEQIRRASAAPETDLRAALADALRRQGAVAAAGQRWDEAVSALGEAAPLYRALDRGADEIDCEVMRGSVLENAYRFDEALVAYGRALDRAQAAGEVRAAGAIQRRIGRVHYLWLNDYNRAEQAFDAAFALLNEAGAAELADEAALERGLVEERRGAWEQALARYAAVRERASARGDRLRLAKAALFSANTQWYRGEYADAYRGVREAYGLAEELGDASLMMLARSTEGLIRWMLNDGARALALQREVLEQARRLGRPLDEATAHNNLALVHRSGGRLDESLSELAAAAQIDRRAGNRWALGYDLRNTGLTLAQAGRLDEAVAQLREAAELSAAIGNRENEAKAHAGLGSALLRKGDRSGAEAAFNKALEVAREISLPEVEWRALHGRAQLPMAAGDLAAARDLLEQALAVIERMRARLMVEELRNGFLEDKAVVYGDLVTVLLRMGGAGPTAESFHVAERARSRGFLDLLGNGRLTLKTPLDQQLFERQEAARRELEAAARELARARAESFPRERQEALERAARDAEQAYGDALLAIRLESPELAGLVTVDPVRAGDVQSWLEPGTALVEYLVLEDRTYVWVLRHDRLRAIEIPAGRAALETQVREFVGAIQALEPVQAQARALYAELFAPVAAALEGADRVGFVPFGPLHYLPFAALFDGQAYLVDRFAIFVAPSASVLGHCLAAATAADAGAPAADTAGVLAIGNPDQGDPAYALPFAEREAQRVQWEFPQAEVLTGGAATESRLKSDAARYRIIHIASHGLFDPFQPLLSSLLLARDEREDGALTAEEVLALRLNADLVTLSGCQTGVAQLRAGDELVGLNRSFVYAGTRAILSTLWRVNDVASALIVKHFYRSYPRLDRAESLRQAQLAVRRYYEHPMHWAGFVLTGDYRRGRSVEEEVTNR